MGVSIGDSFDYSKMGGATHWIAPFPRNRIMNHVKAGREGELQHACIISLLLTLDCACDVTDSHCLDFPTVMG